MGKRDSHKVSSEVLEEERRQAIALSERGLSCLAIGEVVSAHAHTVGRWLKRYAEKGSAFYKPRPRGRRFGECCRLSIDIAMSDNALSHGDLYVCAQYDHSFHEELVRRTQNPVLWDAYKRVKAKEVALLSRLKLAYKRVERGIRDHKDIVRLIRLGQRREAIDKLYQHTVGNEIATPDQLTKSTNKQKTPKEPAGQ